ncbi:hypothetical protein ACLB1S_09115 [Escherichia coli]
MIRLYPEQLRAQLNEGLRAAYLYLVTILCYCQESQDAVRRSLRHKDSKNTTLFPLNTNTDWNAIFSLCQAMSLFASRQTLLLLLPENGPNAAINEQLLTLTGLLHDDLLLMTTVIN